MTEIPVNAAGPLDVFLTPIAEGNPSGDSLRYDAVYGRIRKMRESEDPTLPQGVWQRELKRADWGAVVELCTTALTSRTKDLQLAAWLTEAWLHLESFRGLAQGLRLMTAFCTNFWDTLYPPIEDGKLELRMAPVAWMVEKLVFPVKATRVTAPRTEDAQPAAWMQWEAAVHQKTVSDRARMAGQQVTDDGTAAQAIFLRSVNATPGAWFAALAADIQDALDALAAFETVVLERAGEDATPSFTPLRSILHDIHEFIRRQRDERVASGEIAKNDDEATPMLHVSDDDSHPEQVEAPFAEVAGGAPAARPTGAIGTRAEAYQRLRDASDYLMRTEPHSPVPYLVRRAIAWGNLSLAELLEELLQKNADLPTIYALLGIKRT
jgi:type VI secretion system ImpA family protein